MAELEQMEKTIITGIETFVSVGICLAEISKRKLYKLRGFSSFGEYCEAQVVVGCCVRSFPPVESFCLRKDEHNIWRRDDALSPDDLDGKAELTPTRLFKCYKIENISQL